ncbi:MAG: N-acetyltransferase [Segetibacter sp.]|jgi:ribosomal-protein-alanine N-acetyltransferase|nr:N-acetyltransferase [Segetibacter sp.]
MEASKLKVYLRAFESADLTLLNEWHNDEEINSLTGGRKHFVSSEYDKKWLEDKMLNNTKQLYWAICETATRNMVGYTSLNDIDFVNRKAFMGGLVIGDKATRSKGYATKAAILLLNYGFYELGLNKIYATCLSEHKTVVLTFLMLGFKRDGILRQDVFKGNKFRDVIMVSLLKEEYEKNSF